MFASAGEAAPRGRPIAARFLFQVLAAAVRALQNHVHLEPPDFGRAFGVAAFVKERVDPFVYIVGGHRPLCVRFR
jgi:hypothetical protein